jgi:hypothetical protein
MSIKILVEGSPRRNQLEAQAQAPPLFEIRESALIKLLLVHI